jgi:hypothetical protein
MADLHELPVEEVYKDVPIYGLQAPERIAEARRQITEVVRMRSVDRLFGFACDASRAPEARQLARYKCLASLEQRQSRPIDVVRLEASTVGIERRTTVLGRLIGGRHAGWPGAGWPTAWLPTSAVSP